LLTLSPKHLMESIEGQSSVETGVVWFSVLQG